MSEFQQAILDRVDALGQVTVITFVLVVLLLTVVAVRSLW